MISLLPFAVVTLSVLYATYCYRRFALNLAEAKQSGIPYVILPVHLFSRFWLIFHRLIIPYLERLPSSWTKSWLQSASLENLCLTCANIGQPNRFTEPEWAWLGLHEPFARLKSDILMFVSPSRSTVWVCDADAISQITTRRNDFPKPIEIYKSVSIYGTNVVSTEGAMWRHHRKITSPPFTEKNNHLVWAESLHQAQSMLTSWVGKDGERNKTVTTVAKDTMRLSLHIISRAGFGVRLLWPGVETTEGGRGEEGIDTEGHEMSYTDALGSLLHNLVWLILLPQWLLSKFQYLCAN